MKHPLKVIVLPVSALIFTISACSLPAAFTSSPTGSGSQPTQSASTALPTPLPSGDLSNTSTPDVPTASPTATPIVPTATLSPAKLTPLSVAVNCRYGPSPDYLILSNLMPGDNVLILGTDSDRNWWEIEDPDNPALKCWVSDPVVVLSGDAASVPVVPVPDAYVIRAAVSIDKTTVHGTCGGPNPDDFTGSITTNGPVTVVFHWEIWKTGGAKLNSTADQNLVFPSATTLTDNPGSKSEDCGKYTVKLVVTSPNPVTAQAQWQVVSP